MRRIQVPFSDSPFVKIKIQINGVAQETDVMVDTGFSALGTGAGLKLKSWRASNIPALGSTRLKVGDGREVDFGFAPAVGIIAIDQHAFPKPIPVPAIFGEGVEALGIMFLLFCVSIFDGPSGFLTIDMP